MGQPPQNGGDWALPGSSSPPPGWSAEQPPPSAAAPPYAAGGWTAPGPAGSGWGTPYAAPPPPPRPGIIPLRPLGVGELLDGAFTAIRRYPKPMLGLTAVVMLVVTAVDVLTQWWLLHDLTAPAPDATLSDASGYLGRVGTATAVTWVVTAVATMVLSGMLTAIIGEAVLGRPVAIGDAWRRLRPVLARLFGATVMVSLLVVAFMLPGIVLSILAAVAAPLLLILSIPLMVVGAAYAWVAFSFAPAAVVLERATVRGSLSRSRRLVRGSWWRVFGILLLAGLIAGVVSGIISLPFGLAGGGLATLGEDNGGVGFSQLLLTGIGSLLASTIVRPFSSGVIALLYIDRRIRAEALDVTLVRAAAPETTSV